MARIAVDVDDGVMRELELLVAQHREHGAPYRCESVPDLAAWMLTCCADGSRRPGSWERQAIMSMGLVPDTPNAAVYRQEYGAQE